MNANEAIEYIHSVCWKGSVPGLERTRELLARMGNPEKQLKFVHIAGTNGKGSFQLSLIYFLSTRSLQFAVTIVLDVLVLYLLFRAKIFDRMGVWPPKAREK